MDELRVKKMDVEGIPSSQGYQDGEGHKEGCGGKGGSKGKGELSNIVEYGDIFPEKLLYGPPPWCVVDHKIEVILGPSPPHKRLYRLNKADMEESRAQVNVLLE